MSYRLQLAFMCASGDRLNESLTFLPKVKRPHNPSRVLGVNTRKR